MLDRPSERHLEIGHVGIKWLQRTPLVRTLDGWDQAFGEVGEKDGVAATYLVGLAAHGQLLKSKLPHRLQHLEARLTSWPLDRLDQAFADKRRDAIQDRDALAPCLANDLFGGLYAEPANEDGKAPEEGLLVVGEQVVAPGNGIPHGP
jgi:hypothetical protein